MAVGSSSIRRWYGPSAAGTDTGSFRRTQLRYLVLYLNYALGGSPDRSFALYRRFFSPNLARRAILIEKRYLYEK